MGNGSTSLFDFDFLQALVVAVIVAVPGVIAAVLAARSVRQSRLNAVMLHTNSGKTIGQHIEQLQEDQMVLRDELRTIARQKVKDDAVLAAASLEAIAKLTAASDADMQATARVSADELLVRAERTAHLLTPEGRNEPATETADALMAKAGRTAHLLAGTIPTKRTARKAPATKRTARK